MTLDGRSKPTCALYLAEVEVGVGVGVGGSEAHLAAVSAQDGVAHELLGVELQLVGVLQGALGAHLLNALLT